MINLNFNRLPFPLVLSKSIGCLSDMSKMFSANDNLIFLKTMLWLANLVH